MKKIDVVTLVIEYEDGNKEYYSFTDPLVASLMLLELPFEEVEPRVIRAKIIWGNVLDNYNYWKGENMNLIKTEDGLYTKNMKVLIEESDNNYIVFDVSPKYCGKFSDLESAKNLAKSILLEKELNDILEETEINYSGDLIEYASSQSYNIKYDYDDEKDIVLITIDNNKKDGFLKHLKDSVEIMLESVEIKINFDEEEWSMENGLE